MEFKGEIQLLSRRVRVRSGDKELSVGEGVRSAGAVSKAWHVPREVDK